MATTVFRGYETATQSTSGLMSATDKTKLDGIADGATANVVSNSLTDTSTTNALSAAKGKALNDSISTLNSKIVLSEYIGWFTNITDLFTVIKTKATSMTVETINVIFVAGFTTDYWSNGTYFTGFLTKIDGNNYKALFSNQIGEILSIGTYDNGAGFQYESSKKLKSNLADAVYNADCNNMTNANICYYADGNTANKPTGISSWLLIRVIGKAGEFVTQIASEENVLDGRIWYRTKTSSTWGSWHELALNDNIAQLGELVVGTKNVVNCPNGGTVTTIGSITLNKGRWIIFVNGWSPLGDVQENATQISVSDTFGCATIPFRLFSMSGLAYVNSDNTVLNLNITNWESQAKTSDTIYDFYATRIGF